MDRSRQRLRSGFTRLSKARERMANASVAFSAIEKADSIEGHREWVSRGNKFWQIVLPALYTVAHEVERSVPSSRPPLRDRGGLFPFLPFPPLRGSTVGTCIPVIAGKGHMRLVPLERKRCHFLLAIFLVPAVRSFPILLSPFSIFPFSLASLLSWYRYFSFYILRTYSRFSYCDQRAPDGSPFRRTCMQ